MVDKAFLNDDYLEVEIRELARPPHVRGIGAKRHKSSRYIVQSLFFTGTLEARQIQSLVWSHYAYIRPQVNDRVGVLKTFVLWFGPLRARRTPLRKVAGRAK